jgi:membrane protease YdiL (CAAX protease family)
VTTATVAPAASRRQLLRIGLLAAGFGVAVALRIAVGGVQPARSPIAGLVFAAALAALVVANGRCRARLTPASVAVGCAGAAVLAIPAAVHHALAGGVPPGGAYLPWAIVVAAVAAAEEAFLRGALHERVEAAAGPVPAVGVGAIAFAALHVPLYGLAAAPLDLAVGLWLGWLRVVTGGWAAPAVAHVGADLAGWWLR